MPHELNETSKYTIGDTVRLTGPAWWDEWGSPPDPDPNTRYTVAGFSDPEVVTSDGFVHAAYFFGTRADRWYLDEEEKADWGAVILP